MYDILDFVQTYLAEAWNNFIVRTIVDILCIALIIYVIYHIFLTLNDCLATPEVDNYVHGGGDFGVDTDTSTSTESDFEETFEQNPISKSTKVKEIHMNEFTMGEITEDESTDEYSVRRPDRSSSNVNLEPLAKSSDQNNEQSDTFDSLSGDPCSRPLDQNLDNTNLFLAGSGDSTSFQLHDNLSYSHLSTESGDGIFSLEFLSTTQPIAHSSPLRKNNQSNKKH